MSVDKNSMDKGGSTETSEPPLLYFVKVMNGELYLREESHEVQDDLDQYINVGTGQLQLDGEIFKVTVE